MRQQRGNHITTPTATPYTCVTEQLLVAGKTLQGPKNISKKGSPPTGTTTSTRLIRYFDFGGSMTDLLIKYLI